VSLGGGFRAKGEVKLAGTTIAGDLDCSGGTFDNFRKTALDAGRAHIGGSVILGGDDFQANGCVQFPGTTIDRDLDLKQVKQEQKEMFLQLGGAKTGRLLDDLKSWRALKGFELDGFVYKTLTGEWIDAKSRLSLLDDWQRDNPFRPQPYYQLANVLRELGQESDVKQVLIAKEEARRRSLSWDAWAWNWFLGKSMAHGYQPQWLLILAVFPILLGGLMFAWGYRLHLMIPTKAEAYAAYEQTGQVPAFYPTFSPWLYSLDTFLPIINLGQKDKWRPRDSAPTASDPTRLSPASAKVPLPSSSPMAKGEQTEGFEWVGAMYRKMLTMLSAWVANGWPLGLYRYFHIACGWLLITLGIAGVTGLVRKE
jgi:hypothetical protein